MFPALLTRFHAKYAPLVAERKTSLFGDLRGTVLEIGAGTGVNLPYLAKDIRWIGIDPNPYLPPYVSESAKRNQIDALFGAGIAEELPARDASVDAVVSTLVLCCVRDLSQVLREIIRVLKPGGKFVFIEHVAASPGTSTRRWQSLVTPLWSHLGDNCHPNRETWKWIEAAGFADVQYEKFSLKLPITGPHIAGFATK